MKIYCVTTRHPEYARDYEFEPGSVVLDPWRYVTDRPGVDVRRIGENKPDLISLLVPTRGRLVEFTRMFLSAWDNATHQSRIEIIAYLDEDDPQTPSYFQTHPDWPVHFAIGDRVCLSEMWNHCFTFSHGSILMHCGDDVVFRTPGWDSIVRRAFAESEDKLILVHGDDCSPNTDALATHGFLHRRWVETVGYFVPPYFSSDWNDVWLTEVADTIGRRVKVPIVTEHMHYSFDKRPRDQTDLEREQRGRDDDVVELYKRKARERRRDADKLRQAFV